MEIKRKKESESERKKRRSRFKMRELSDYMTSELRVILKFKNTSNHWIERRLDKMIASTPTISVSDNKKIKRYIK